jgi:hypothetical protein
MAANSPMMRYLRVREFAQGSAINARGVETDEMIMRGQHTAAAGLYLSARYHPETDLFPDSVNQLGV